MRATEMHDLLKDALAAIAAQAWHPGNQPGFTHIEYCTYCGMSRSYAAEHSHGDKCVLARLERAVKD